MAFEELIIGARFYSLNAHPPCVQGWFDGDISEVLVYSRGLSDAERALVEKYLSANNPAQNLAGRKMGLEITDRAKALIADKGYDPVYGARPLKRTIQRLIQDPLAVKILEGEFGEGDRVKVDAAGDELVFVHGEGGATEESYEQRTLH